MSNANVGRIRLGERSKILRGPCDLTEPLLVALRIEQHPQVGPSECDFAPEARAAVSLTAELAQNLGRPLIVVPRLLRRASSCVGASNSEMAQRQQPAMLGVVGKLPCVGEIERQCLFELGHGTYQVALRPLEVAKRPMNPRNKYTMRRLVGLAIGERVRQRQCS